MVKKKKNFRKLKFSKAQTRRYREQKLFDAGLKLFSKITNFEMFSIPIEGQELPMMNIHHYDENS